jgi:hypothetical protein
MFAEWKSKGSGPGPRNIFGNPLLYTSSALLLAIIYTGAAFLSHWENERKLEQKIAEKQAQQRADDERAFEILGGNRFEILNFYVAPPMINRGETAQLCYGVSNTKVVRLDPPAGSMWPALTRCIRIEPKKNTAYTLTAEDAEGHTKTATVTLQVR